MSRAKQFYKNQSYQSKNRQDAFVVDKLTNWKKVKKWIIHRPCEGIEKTVKHKSDNHTEGTGGNKRTSGDHPNYSIVEIGQNTEKSPGDFKTCCLSNSSESPSAKTDVKNLKSK